MSIDVSASVKPSRCYAVLITGLISFFWLTGILIYNNSLGVFDFFGKMILIPVFLLAGMVLIFHYFRVRKTFRIDISGNGEICLRQYTGSEHDIPVQEGVNRQKGEALQLSEGSVIWPWLLILHCKSKWGTRSKVMIFYDSVSLEEYKMLYIACRWIDAQRKNEEF